MKRSTRPRRVTTAAATALTTAATSALASLVWAVSPASAATATSAYTCTDGQSTPETAQVQVTIAMLPPTAPAGFLVPAGMLSSQVRVTYSSGLSSALTQAQADGASAPGFTAALGPLAVSTPLTLAHPTVQQDGRVVMTGTGANPAFRTVTAGTHAVTLPATFTFTPQRQGQRVLAPLTCRTTAPARLGTITLSKQRASVQASAPRSTRQGARTKLSIRVANEYSAAGGAPVAGRVTVRSGGRVVASGTLVNGRAVVRTKKWTSPGSKPLVVRYLGDGYTRAGTATRKVTVRRK